MGRLGGADLITKSEESHGETFRIEMWPDEKRAKVTDVFGEYGTISLGDGAWLGEYKSEKYHTDLAWQTRTLVEAVRYIEQALVSVRPPDLKPDEAERQMVQYANSLEA